MKSGSTKAYVIQSTYFGYSTNLTGIFYVPDAPGEILFEVWDQGQKIGKSDAFMGLAIGRVHFC